MSRKIVLPLLLAAGVAGISVLGWSNFSDTISSYVSKASAQSGTERPISPEKLDAALKSRLIDVQTRMKDADAATLAQLLRQQDKLLREIADPASAVAAALENRALLNGLRKDYGLPDPDGSATAAAQLDEGDIAGAGPLFTDIRAQAESEIRRAARVAFGLGKVALAQADPAAAVGFLVRAAEIDARYEYLFAAVKAMQESGNAAGAAALSGRLINAAVSQFGESSAEHAEALSWAGQASLANKRVQEAEALMRKAIEVGSGVDEGRSQAQAQRLNNLGVLLQAAGYPKDAEPFLRQSVDVDLAAPAGFYPEASLRLANLAAFLVATGKLTEAEGVAAEALEIAKQEMGTTNPDLANRMIALAQIQQALGRNDDAAAMFEAAISPSRLTLGPYHPNFMQRLGQLADGLRGNGAYDAAGALYREILDRSAAKYGTQSAEYGRALNNLGLFLADTGDRAGAEKAYREAIAVLTPALGDGHENIKTVQANLGALLAK
jgi:Tfp pilus assembly protein PilF